MKGTYGTAPLAFWQCPAVGVIARRLLRLHDRGEPHLLGDLLPFGTKMNIWKVGRLWKGLGLSHFGKDIADYSSL